MANEKNPDQSEKKGEPEPTPRPEIPTTPRVHEVPDRPSREIPQHDPERAGDEARPAPAT